VQDIREAIARAQAQRAGPGRKTVLFVDAIHLFNKSPQDAFLPYLDNGTVILMAATTENPSFALNNALLSRCRVYVFRSLETPAILRLLQAALDGRARGLCAALALDPRVLAELARGAGRDARRALRLLAIA